MPGWAGRTEVQRVRLYTVGSLYLIYWLLVPILALSAAVKVPDAVVMGVVIIVVGVAGTFTFREAVALYPDHAPVPWRELSTLVALAVTADVLGLPAAGESAFLGDPRDRGHARLGRRWSARSPDPVVPVRRLRGPRARPDWERRVRGVRPRRRAVPGVHRAELAVAAGRGHRAGPGARHPGSAGRRRRAAALLARRARRARSTAVDHRRSGRARRHPDHAR